MEAGTKTDYEGFKVPSSIPQDILLIQDLVGPVIPPTKPVTSLETDSEDSIDSSGESTDSVEEVEANLISVDRKSRSEGSSSADSETSSDSSSSSDSGSESESERDAPKKHIQCKTVDGDDEEDEEGGALATASSLHTKNELPETDVIIPPITQVGPEEHLEKVGEIMNIVNNVVIVKGAESGTHRALERALDSETLLVYEDRRVLGYIHETFGPTYLPMYQVRFNSSFPLDVNEAQVSRPVFHVPARSKYVFVAELSKLHGSDASNVHDEEPGEYELEFSDDEAEVKHKAKLRDRRHASREPSVPASPAHVRDQDLDASFGWNPYAEHGVYDMDLDYGAGPSRPVPQPYDDPYSDAYNRPEVRQATATSRPTPPSRPERRRGSATGQSDFGQGQGRDGQRAHHHHRERGRGRGRAGGRGHGRGRGRGRGGAHGQGREGHTPPPHRTDDNGTHGPMPISPTLMAIAQATGQYPGASEYTPFSPQLPQFGFAQPYSHSSVQQQFMSPQQAVQPHINPMFAAKFGLDMGTVQQQQQPGQQYLAYGQYGTPTTPVYEGGWDGQWNQDYDGELPNVNHEHDHNS